MGEWGAGGRRADDDAEARKDPWKKVGFNYPFVCQRLLVISGQNEQT